MDDALALGIQLDWNNWYEVLILVVMDDALARKTQRL